MKVPVIKIGNSKGIRLSKTVLNKYEIRTFSLMVLTLILWIIAMPYLGYVLVTLAGNYSLVAGSRRRSLWHCPEHGRRRLAQRRELRGVR